eukprot:scaffold37998_cov157-Skeletonema_marinoi.AAC.2
MRSITPSTPFVQSTTNTIVTNSSHNSTLPHTILPLNNDGNDDALSNTTAPTTTTTPTKFFLSMSKRKLTIMIILSLLLPLVGVYCMSVFHPWIDWVGGALLFCSSEDDASSIAAAVHVDGDGASFNGTALVKKDHMLHHHSAASFVKEDWYQQRNGRFSSFPSFVEHEVTPRQIDGIVDYGIVATDKDGVGEDGVVTPYELKEKMPHEEEGSTSNDAHTSSNDDVICINCHALFRIHVDVSYLSSTAAIESSSSLVMNTTTQEKKNWFITLRDVTYDNDELMYVYQMDRPLDLHCGSSATASAVHRSNDVVCDHSSSSKGSGCNDDTNHNSHVYLQKCQSTAIIEVPYTSFSSSSSRYNHSSNYHEVTNERIILVSLLREWSSSSSSQSSEVMIMAKKRRIVDQWMINIVVPNENGGGRRGSVVHSSSIYSAKLRDMVKYDNSIVSKELSKESEAFTGESSSSSSSSSSTMNEVIIACLVGVLCGLAILAIAFKFVDQDEEEEEEEEELMTTPGILALQHAIRGSNSFERSDDGEAESPHQQQQQSPQYESNQDRSPSEEQLEAWSAIEQSTPTNLSPLFDDEAETIERASNHHDEADGTEIDDTIQEQSEGFEGFEEVDESRHDDDEESEVEGSIQDRSEEDTHALDEDEAATEMIGEDEETPPTSNKTNKQSTAPRRNSLENIIQEQNESTAISSPLFYSPKYQSNETAPLPHSNTSSVYDQVEHVDGADSNPTTSVEPAIMLLSNRAETNQPPIDYRSEWNEFGAFVHDREVLNADDNKAAATCAGTEEETVHEAKDDPALSGVSKRLFATSKQTTDEVEKASPIHEEVDEVATASSIHEECEEVDESMFLPNVNIQAEANASPSNFQEQRNIPAEATTSPPKLHRATMESNAMASLDLNPVNKPTASSDDLVQANVQANVQAEAKAFGSPLAEPLPNSQQSINLQSDSPSEMAIAANASATSNKSPPVSSPSNKAYPTLKSVNTPPTAPMSSSKEDDSPVSCASAASFTKASVEEKSAAKFEVAPGNLGNSSSINAAQQLPASPSPESHHDLSYVNQSLSLSSSPSVTSPPRKSNSPSVTSDPRFSPGGWNNSDIGSNDEVRQRKRRSLPFVSREDTSRAGKENASSNSRTPLSAKASKYSPSSTVAATVAEFAVPRKQNGLAWRAERPVPVPSGGAGQNKRLGGSPAHFEPRGASTKGDKSSNDEAIDFMNGADLSSQNDDSEPNGSSRSGKRSRSSRGSNKNTSRKRKTK